MTKDYTMNIFPDNPKKIKAQIRSYERKLQEEQEEHGFINDGYGKRYLLGPLYMLIDDNEGALQSYAWFETQFPDDVGEPMQYLCWTLALYRAGDLEAAARKLRQTMLSNLYLIPRLLGQDQEKLDIWHGSNLAEKAYLEYIPPELFDLWDEAALKWVQETYNSPEMIRKRKRYIEIYRQLKNESPGSKRSRLVQEASKIR
jgi:hypothetical protein